MIDFCYENPELVREDGKCPAHGWACAPQENPDMSDEDVRDDLIINITQRLDELPTVTEEELDQLSTPALRHVLMLLNSIKDCIDQN